MNAGYIDPKKKTILIIGSAINQTLIQERLQKALKDTEYSDYTIQYSTSDGPINPGDLSHLEPQKYELNLEAVERQQMANLKDMDLEKNKQDIVDRKNWLGCPNDHWKRKGKKKYG